MADAGATILSTQEAAIASGSKTLHPGVSDRVMRMFEALRTSGPPRVALERAVYFTESFKTTEGQPLVWRWAKALQHIAENISVAIFDDELIVGRPNTWFGRYSLVYPELDGTIIQAGAEAFIAAKGLPWEKARWRHECTSRQHRDHHEDPAAPGDAGDDEIAMNCTTGISVAKGRGIAPLAALAIFCMLPHAGAAQTTAGQPPPAQAAAAGPSASELARQTQNPIASLISFPLEANWDMGVGDRETTSTLLNIQPVVPFAISKSTNVILRVIMPLTSKPSSDADGGRSNGLGDIVFSAFLSPAESGRVIWGVGPVLLLPSATNAALGTEKFGIGPTAVVLVQPGKWTIGALANQIWSTSGASDREDINTTYLQPFIVYNLEGGLSVGVAAETTGNWKADEGKWSSPLLFDVSKVTVLGKRPVKLKFAAGPTLGPDSGPNWRFRFQANFLFPK